MLGEHGNDPPEDPSGGTPLAKSPILVRDDDIPPTQPDPDPVEETPQQVLSFEVWSSKSR